MPGTPKIQNYEKLTITINPADVLDKLPFVVASMFICIICANDDKDNELENLKQALRCLQRAKQLDLFGFSTVLALAVFRFSDIYILRYAAKYIEHTNDDEEAIEDLRSRLERSIKKLEGEKSED